MKDAFETEIQIGSNIVFRPNQKRMRKGTVKKITTRLSWNGVRSYITAEWKGSTGRLHECVLSKSANIAVV